MTATDLAAHPKCGAATKRSGEPCKQPAMENGRCRLHGGLTPSGIASPQFRHGRYSKHLPTRLGARYLQAATDETLLHLRDDIAVLEARLADLFETLDTGESGAVWAALAREWAEFRDAMARGDAQAMREQALRVSDLISRGSGEWAQWAGIIQVMDAKRKLGISERKRIIEAEQVLTTEQAYALVSALLDSVRKHVRDRNALAAIAADFARIAG